MHESPLASLTRLSTLKKETTHLSPSAGSRECDVVTYYCISYLQDVGEGDLCRPVSLERIDADVPVGCDVRVVDLREKEPAGR